MGDHYEAAAARRVALAPPIHKVCGTPCPSRHELGALPHTPHGGASQRRLAPSGGAQGAQIAMRRCCAQRTSVSEGRQAPRRRTESLIGVARGATDPRVACSTACRTTARKAGALHLASRAVRRCLACAGTTSARTHLPDGHGGDGEGTRAAHKASTAGCECDRTPQLVDFMPTHPPRFGVDADPRACY